MSKLIRNYPIYIAPGIKAVHKENGTTEVYDEIKDIYYDPYIIDDKIIIYERQVKEWFLNRALRYKNGGNNGFVVLMVAISYIEGIQQYINGYSSRGGSRGVFTEGFKRIFPDVCETDAQIKDFYKEVRCGLFHNGMSGHKIVISNKFERSIDFHEPDTININPKIFLEIVNNNFKEYINILKDVNNITERRNFHSMFNIVD